MAKEIKVVAVAGLSFLLCGHGLYPGQVRAVEEAGYGCEVGNSIFLDTGLQPWGISLNSLAELIINP